MTTLRLPRRISSLLALGISIVLLSILPECRGDDAYQAGGYDDQYNNNQQQADDDGNGMNANGYGYDYQQGDDYIKYWTDYAILPKRCIV